MCFFFGGIGRHEQQFNNTAASTMASLMAVASASLIIPAALYQTIALTKEPNFDSILHLSRATAIVLLVLYMMYIYFQFFSHHKLFVDDAKPKEPVSDGQAADVGTHGNTNGTGNGTSNGSSNGNTNGTINGNASESEEDPPVLSRNQAAAVLLITTVVVSFCADYLVGTIDSIVDAAGLSKTFIGLILIPIVGNAAEHVTSVVVALEDKVEHQSFMQINTEPLLTS